MQQRNSKVAPESAETPKCLRLARAARELDVSVRTIWRLINEGKLRLIRVGRSARVETTSLQAFIAKGGAR